MCGRDDPIFALPICAVLGFQIFSNAVLRVKSLPIPTLEYFYEPLRGEYSGPKKYYEESHSHQQPFSLFRYSTL